MAEGNSGKPADFFVGLVDFFAIILPGAILTFLLYRLVEYKGQELLPSLPSEGWVPITAFALLAYVLGHLLFVIGSLCLDPLYDWLKCIFGKRKELKEKADDLAIEKSKALAKTVEPFHWILIEVRLRSAAAAAELDRLEADQKFFRGLILVLLFAWPLLLWVAGKPSTLQWVGLLLLLGFSCFPFRILKGSRVVKAVLKVKEHPIDAEREHSRKILARFQFAFLICIVAVWSAFSVWTPWAQPSELTLQSREQPVEAATKEAVGTVSKSSGAAVEKSPSAHSLPNAAGQKVSLNKLSIALVLGFGLALCAVRFVQQRLKYTEYAYRAYLVLSTMPGLESNDSSDNGSKGQQK